MIFHRGFSLTRRIRSIARFNAFTLIELLILIGIFLLVACVLLPSLAYQRRHAKIRACVKNLKQVGVAFRTWTLDGGDSYPAEVDVKRGGAREELAMGHVFFNFLVMSNELSTPKILVCPADDGKTVAANFNSNFNDANVSYFVGADAKDTFPQMFLSGDRNLAFENNPPPPGIFVWTSNRSALSWTKAIHNTCGNVGLADGSVQFFDSRKLAAAAADQCCETNRLAIP
jgi:type II secretory pathway pseudopilin PulG